MALEKLTYDYLILSPTKSFLNSYSLEDRFNRLELLTKHYDAELADQVATTRRALLNPDRDYKDGRIFIVSASRIEENAKEVLAYMAGDIPDDQRNIAHVFDAGTRQDFKRQGIMTRLGAQLLAHLPDETRFIQTIVSQGEEEGDEKQRKLDAEAKIAAQFLRKFGFLNGKLDKSGEIIECPDESVDPSEDYIYQI